MEQEQKAIRKIYAEITDAVTKGNYDIKQIRKKIEDASLLIEKIEHLKNEKIEVS
jgi:hypothetical protein